MFKVSGRGETEAHAMVVGWRVDDLDDTLIDQGTLTVRGDRSALSRAALTVDLATPAAVRVRVWRAAEPDASERVFDDMTLVQIRAYQTARTTRIAAPIRGLRCAFARAASCMARSTRWAAPCRRMCRCGGPAHGPRRGARHRIRPPCFAPSPWAGATARAALLAGSGRAAASIDHAGLGAWFAWCDAHGLTCDHVVTGGTAEETEALIARCGRASPTWASGKLGVVWEDPDDAPTALVTPARIVAGTLESDWAAGSVAEEIRRPLCRSRRRLAAARPAPAHAGRRQPGLHATLTIPGITAAARALEEANLQAARQSYQRRRLAWEMGRDGLAIARGDVLHLAHDLVTGGKTGRLAGGTAARPLLDRAVAIGAGDSMLFELADGALHSSAVARGSPADPREVVLAHAASRRAVRRRRGGGRRTTARARTT